jgi:uncharacterized membrane protein
MRMKPYRRWIAFCLAFCAAVIAGFFSFYALVQLGALTGVIAMCASAPSWWIWTFVIATPLAILGVATAAAFGTLRWYQASCGHVST